MSNTTAPVQQAYNNYSEKLLSYLPEGIDPNEKVRFVLLPQGNNLMETLTIGGTSEERLTLPHGYTLPRQEDILDPGTNQYIRIAFFDGVVTPTSVPKQVSFTRANICVIEVMPARQPDLYKRLMFSEFNQNNPNPLHRAPGSGYLFELQQPEKSDKQKYSDRLRIQKANEYVALAEVPQLLRLAPKAFVAVPAYKDADGNGLRLNFSLVADANPQRVIDLFEADEEGLFTLVDAAVKHEVIQFDANEAKWLLLPARAYLTTALPGVKAEDAMVQFLIMNENAPILKSLRSAVKQKEANK